MSKRVFWRFLLMTVILSLSMTGCLQAANDADLEGLEARDLNTDTPMPTDTTPQVVTSEPQVVTEVVVVTATDDPNASPSPTETPGDLNIADVSTAETGSVDTEGVAIAQAEETVEVQPQDFPTPEDPLLQEATQIIQDATNTAIAETQTAEAPVVPLATNTATLDPNVFTPTATTAAPVSGADCVHQVQAGENMFRLSLLYGVPIADIAARSGISNPNLIFVGQRLTIPGCGTTGAVPPPTSPPTPGNINQPAAGTPVGSAGGVTYTVQQYDTLFEISQRYGVPVMSIAAANGIANINLITIGDVLTIP